MDASVPRVRSYGAFREVPANSLVCGVRKLVYGRNSFSETIRNPSSFWIGSRHTCTDLLNPGPPYKSGGALSILKPEVDDAGVQARRHYVFSDRIGGVDYTWSYTGGFLPVWPWIGYPFDTADIRNAGGKSGFFSITYGDPSSLGAGAWNKFAPKQSTAGLGVFLGELREAPRMLSTSAGGFADIWRSIGGSCNAKVMFPKRAADHYLNTQFGWIPFLNDLKAFIRTHKEAEKRLAQLSRDNGRWVKREGPVGSSTVETVLSTCNTNGEQAPYFWPMPYEQMMQPCGSGKLYECSIVHRKVTKTSFCGSFRYYVPALVKPNDGLDKLQNYLRLYGANVNPTLIWNLTPWTWLVDWNSNASDIIENWTNSITDNLVSRYAYIMQSQEEYLINSSRMNFKRHGAVNIAWRRGCTSKQRRSADPFGFALDPVNYTERQQAILIALGFSKYKLRSY